MHPLLASDNRLVEFARRGRRLPHVALAIVLAPVLALAAQLIGGALAVPVIVVLSLDEGQSVPLDDVDAVMALIWPDTATELTILLVLSFAPLFVLLWAWLALFEKRTVWTLGLERTGAVSKYARGAGVGLLMFTGAVGLPAALGFMAVEPTSGQVTGIAATGGVLLVLIGWIVQGAAEEALTRGWLLPVVSARYNTLWGILVSSLVFAVLHSLNPGVNPIAMLNLFLVGVFMALYALYEGGLWGVFGIHAIWNWAQGHLFGFEVSGVVPPGGALIDLMEVGPDAITGGAFGPEGGLAVTAILLIGSGVVGWLGHRRASAAGGRPTDETALQT